mgnify:CR=1 FL=1
MTDNIRRLYRQMDASMREEALACLQKEFSLKNRKFVKNAWIIGGRIPEAYQGRIVMLLQNLLRNQVTVKDI